MVAVGGRPLTRLLLCCANCWPFLADKATGVATAEQVEEGGLSATYGYGYGYANFRPLAPILFRGVAAVTAALVLPALTAARLR